jgi:serine/threonine-protein kinase
VKVLDFGISKVDDAASAGGLTKTSALMGTAYYMSPEQMMTPKGIDHRSDIWSLGVILYELLGGRVPFTGDTVPEIVAGILNNEPSPLRELRPDVPPALEAVVVKCMQTKAADRYSSVAKLAAALAPFASANDRAPQSVLAISRVLGEEEQIASTPPPSLAKTELGNAQAQTGPNAGVPPTAASPGIAPLTPGGSFVPQKTALLHTPMPSSQPGIGVTAQAMSTSAITPKKSSPMPMIAGGAALLVALAIGGFVAFGKKSTNADTPSTGGGIVATSSPSTTTSSPPATASAETKAIPTSTSLTVLEPIPSAAPSVAASAGVATRVTTTVTGKGTKPVASAAAVTTAAATPSVTATATASAAATGSKNPLNMGIK